MTDYIIPALFLLIFIVSAYKDLPAYNYFAEGARSAVSLCIGVFPYLCAILVMVQLFRVSGLSEIVGNLLAPFFRFFGVPTELTELILLRPFTGAGSLAVLDKIYEAHGTDSYIGRCASVVIGSSDTVFYVAVVYFSGSKVKKLRYAIPVALICMLFGAIVSCFLCRFL